MTIRFDAAFRKEESFYLGLSRRMSIPARLASPLGPAGQPRYYGPGFGYAAALLLTNGVAIERTRAGLVRVTYPSSGRAGGDQRVASGPAAQGRAWTGALSGATGAALLGMTEALVLGLYPGTLAALRDLARLVRGFVKRDLLSVLPDQDGAVRDAILRLSDAAYYELKTHVDDGRIQAAGVSTDPSEWRAVGSMELRDLLFGAAPPSARSSTGAYARLRRLVKRGGAALLVGPPGTFKTETVKRVALDSGASLVMMKGSPGVEDRDFLGAIVPGQAGPEWVDGPLTRAFALAASGPTVLQIDEVLRYHHEHLNVLVGAMDQLAYDEARALLRPALEKAGNADALLAALLPDPEARYHLLTLPNGDAVVCPARHLTWAMTTNWGEDHLQTASHLDAALLSRIDLVIDVPRAAPEVVLPLYESIAGHVDLARAAFALEELTHEMAGDAEGLLVRALDARKTIALIKEARAAMEEGLSVREAVLEAAFVTAVPHCCPRDARGTLEEASKESLLRRVHDDVLAPL